jgi:hypothetical protein
LWPSTSLSGRPIPVGPPIPVRAMHHLISRNLPCCIGLVRTLAFATVRGTKGECDEELEDAPRGVELVGEEISELAHAIADRLRMDVELGSDIVASPLVEKPRAQRLGEPTGGGGPKCGQRGKRAGT